MERATKDQFNRSSLRDEHFHRYELAARFASGFVVDCACGIGYGSDFLARQNLVESYLGIDPSADAIQYAKDHFGGGRIHFECGTLESHSCAPSSVDRFVMFETLEHTKNPELALESVRRCLKPDGLLIGSVPSAEYESLCESTYGPNTYHLQRFTKDQIARLLGQHFENVRIFSMEFILGSLLQDVDDQSDKDAEIYSSSSRDRTGILGSIVFFAGAEGTIAQVLKEFGAPKKFFPSIPKTILDREEVEPIRVAMQSMEAMIRDKDEALAAQAHAMEERWSAMQSMEAMIRDRDDVITQQKQLLEKIPTIKEAISKLFVAIKHSLRYHLNRVLGKYR